MKNKKTMSKIIIFLLFVSSLFIGALTKATSTAPDQANITIINNTIDLKDKITVNGLLEGDYFTVYKNSTGIDKWGTSPKVLAGSASSSISITQLGITSGNVYISVTSLNSLESNRTQQPYAAEQVSPTPNSADVTISNNVDKVSTITLTGLNSGDKINAYSDIGLAKSTQLGTEAKVNTGSITATINVPDKKLINTGGALYITYKQPGYLTSTPIKVTYTAAQQVSALSNVIVTNNVDNNKKSTISVSGLIPGDRLIAYKDTTYNSKSTWGIATVPTKSTSAAISIANDQAKPESGLGSLGGTVYVSVRRTYYRDSDPIPVLFSQKSKNNAPNASDITVDIFTSYDNVRDVITTKNLLPGDVVYVWNDPTSTKSSALVVKGTVLTGMTTLSLTVPTIKSLSDTGGNIYCSIKSINSLESDRTKVSYQAEP
jgi:hypothetical protein